MPPRRAARNSGPPDNNNSGRVGAAGANRRPPQPQPQPNGARRRISNIRFATIIPVDPEQFRAARQARMERQGGLTVRFAPFSLDDPPVDDEPVEVSDSDESVEVSDSDESTEDGSSEASERPNTDTMAPRPSSSRPRNTIDLTEDDASPTSPTTPTPAGRATRILRGIGTRPTTGRFAYAMRTRGEAVRPTGSGNGGNTTSNPMPLTSRRVGPLGQSSTNPDPNGNGGANQRGRTRTRADLSDEDESPAGRGKRSKVAEASPDQKPVVSDYTQAPLDQPVATQSDQSLAPEAQMPDFPDPSLNNQTYAPMQYGLEAQPFPVQTAQNDYAPPGYSRQGYTGLGLAPTAPMQYHADEPYGPRAQGPWFHPAQAQSDQFYRAYDQPGQPQTQIQDWQNQTSQEQTHDAWSLSQPYRFPSQPVRNPYAENVGSPMAAARFPYNNAGYSSRQRQATPTGYQHDMPMLMPQQTRGFPYEFVDWPMQQEYDMSDAQMQAQQPAAFTPGFPGGIPPPEASHEYFGRLVSADRDRRRALQLGNYQAGESLDPGAAASGAGYTLGGDLAIDPQLDTFGAGPVIQGGDAGAPNSSLNPRGDAPGYPRGTTYTSFPMADDGAVSAVPLGAAGRLLRPRFQPFLVDEDDE